MVCTPLAGRVEMLELMLPAGVEIRTLVLINVSVPRFWMRTSSCPLGLPLLGGIIR